MGIVKFWTSLSLVKQIIIGLIIGGKAKKENPGNKMGKSGWVLALIGLILSAIFTIIGTIIWVIAFREGVVYFE